MTQIITLVLLFVILLILLLKEKISSSPVESVISNQNEIKEKLLLLTKEFSEQLLNIKNQMNQEITHILRDTEKLVLQQVDSTVKTLGKTDENLQVRMDNLRNQLHQTLSSTVSQLTSTVNDTTSHLTKNVDNRLEQLNKNLSATAGLIKDLSMHIGKIHQSTDELRKLNEELKTALTSPKLQGATGELILENILRDVLPREVYKIQYWLSPSDRVDAVIKIEDRILPIDAKFPVDSYKKMATSSSEEYEKNKTEFIKAVKSHIEKVSKYIKPEKGTFDFAFMYIPSEPIFYSLLICEDKGTSLFNYAWSQKKILPVSPQSLFAYLRMILLGLKGKTIEKNAEYIIESVEGMAKLLGNLKDSFEKASKQLGYTSKNFEEAKNYLDKFENEFKNLSKIKLKSLKEKEEEK